LECFIINVVKLWQYVHEQTVNDGSGVQPLADARFIKHD